jgi:MFS family permease
MYTLLREDLPRAAGAASGRRRLRVGVGRTVICLGVTSMLTDISSEMVSSILPLYFVFYLGLSPLGFGFLDGLYQGSSAIVRVAGGFAADRWNRHKDVAVAGYGLSALCKILLLAVGGAWAAITGVLVLDRTGKGIRTAPRDAMISLSTPPESLGTAFGVHRTLDTLGALLGPVVAFGLLTLAPGAFDAVFVVSFCVAIIGLAVLVLFVNDRTPTAQPDVAPRVTPRHAVAMLAAPRFRSLVVAGSLLGVMTVSDAFLYLVLQRRLDLRVGVFPLLYVATAVVYFLLAVPAGRLADRIGRGRVFVGGYALLVGVYTALLVPDTGAVVAALCVVLFGAYYAATDGVLMARASALLPAETRASGLGVLTTATSLSRLVGSVLFGALWTWQGSNAAIACLLAGLLASLVFAWMALARKEGVTHD